MGTNYEVLGRQTKKWQSKKIIEGADVSETTVEYPMKQLVFIK